MNYLWKPITEMSKTSIDYIDGAEVKLDESIEGNLIQGDGIAYGLEILATKNTGKLNGWLSYTFSRSLLEFNSIYDVLTLNGGDLYPSQYDQPHNLSVVMNYTINQHPVVLCQFQLCNRKANHCAYFEIPLFRIPNGQCIFRGETSSGCPDYHRLDLSLTLKSENADQKVAGRMGAFSFQCLWKKQMCLPFLLTDLAGASKVSIVGNMFPSLSYNFRF